MRTLPQLALLTAARFWLLCVAPIQAQTPHEPTDLERHLARHFPETPPVQLEFAKDAEYRPLLIITNSYQFSLTAYAVQIGPKSANDRPQTLIYDALTRVGLLATVPKGLATRLVCPIL
jgi:hypothetical protein